MKEREDAICFSVICDPTLDISHTEQNVLLLRYIKHDAVNNDKNGLFNLRTSAERHGKKLQI